MNMEKSVLSSSKVKFHGACTIGCFSVTLAEDFPFYVLTVFDSSRGRIVRSQQFQEGLIAICEYVLCIIGILNRFIPKRVRSDKTE